MSRIAWSYTPGGRSAQDDLHRAQELIEESRRREEEAGWEKLKGGESAKEIPHERERSTASEPENVPAGDPMYEEAIRVLGVRSGATEEEVKAAYRRIVVQYHPDRTAHLEESRREEARRRTQQINQAYEFFKDYFAARGKM